MRMLPLTVLTVALAAVGASAAADTGGPRLAPRKVDQTSAARAVFRLSDFPVGWKRVTSWTVDAAAVGAGCDRFSPDLSRWTVTGLSGRMFLRRDRGQQVASLVAVFQSRNEALRLWQTDYLRYFDQCLRAHVGHTVNGVRFISARRLQLRPLPGAAATGARVVVDLGNSTGMVDQIFVMRGRTVANVILQAGTTDPPPALLERKLITRLTGRIPPD